MKKLVGVIMGWFLDCCSGCLPVLSFPPPRKAPWERAFYSKCCSAPLSVRFAACLRMWLSDNCCYDLTYIGGFDLSRLAKARHSPRRGKQGFGKSRKGENKLRPLFEKLQ